MRNLLKSVKKSFLKISPEREFLSNHYQRHNQRRLEHLASLGLAIEGSTVLEVGAGIGDHTSFFLDRGCRVLSTDARKQNLKILNSRYPDLKTLVLDLDNPNPFLTEVFDIVYCYGLLYHLSKPTEAIEYMSQRCQKFMLLETCVSFGNKAEINFCQEPVEYPTQSASSIGCRPTRDWLFKQLQQYFDFVYVPLTQPFHEEFPIDWTIKPSPSILTRAVFIASKKELTNNLLTRNLPTRQTRS
jgi:ubiquinone/menaquinone biosynthesis C-methylase UbiE